MDSEGRGFYVAPGWREATRRIRFAQAMATAYDLSESQYVALHDGRRVDDLDYEPHREFVVDRVGLSEDRHFQDVGIEYYRYAG